MAIFIDVKYLVLSL